MARFHHLSERGTLTFSQYVYSFYVGYDFDDPVLDDRVVSVVVAA